MRIYLLPLLVFCLITSSQAMAQSGCNDPNACNFFPEAESNEFCWYPSYLIPVIDGTDTAIEYCFGTPGVPFPVGFTYANQECVENVVLGDPFCINSSWDSFCQTAYEDCCPTNSWYLPANPFNSWPGLPTLGGGEDGLPGAGPIAVLSCSAPPGYVEAASQTCVESFISGNPYCSLVEWDNFCQESYNECLFGCPEPLVYIPDACGVPIVLSQRGGIGDGTPAIISCDGPPLGYIEALSQECALNVIASDPFCVSTEWDSVCENAYNACASGCTYSFACNYNPIAVFDDGSCGYPGCTDPAALNYDPNATCDNLLCIFEETNVCAADFNDDGTVTVADLLIFLPLFGGICVN